MAQLLTFNAINAIKTASTSSNQVPLQYETKYDILDTYFQTSNHEFEIFQRWIT